MRNRLAGSVTVSFACAFVCLGVAHAQFGRGPAEWSTAGGDAHRSSSVATDPKISKESVQKGFALFWKMKLNNEARQLNGLTAPTLMDRHIGIHGFRSFGFVTGSGDNVYAVDTDLARIDWQKNFGGKPPADASMTCPGGMTSGTARSIGAAFPATMPAGRGGGGGFRGAAAKSGVGEAGEGGVTIKELEARAAAAAANAPAGRGSGGGFGGGRGARMPVVVNTLSSDGMFHSNYVSNGDEPEPPIRFLPPNANAQGLVIIDNVAYVATVNGCGGVPNGIWALDIAAKEVASWKPAKGDVAGSAGPAFGGDGTVYVSTTSGDLVALEPKTLKVKDVHSVGAELTSSPVVFQHKDKTFVSVTAKDGRLHLVDTSAMAGADVKSAPYSSVVDFTPGALATWQDAAGVRWILAPMAGLVSNDAKLAANGAVTNGAIAAWKVVDQDGAPALEAGWASRDLTSPLTPLVVNGVVFAVSSGEFRSKDAKMTAAQRAQRSAPAVVYALDGATGKELWNSGKTITSFVHGGGLSGAGGQIYLGTHDGTLYSFGFPIEH
uniref:Pyrrolo-quinoline quinone n=1 Tax=Solibacter usitatus (strain Ellin6076) TaxID=234267 RepID=Q01NQ2_SOLUE